MIWQQLGINQEQDQVQVQDQGHGLRCEWLHSR